MEWDKGKGKGKAFAAAPAEESGGVGEFGKVMTEEQVEVLRKQISIYATICEQLFEMHRAITMHHDSIAGVGLGSNLQYADPVTVNKGSKFTARQR